MISIPNRRRRLLFCGATAKQGQERLEQGALTLSALAVVTAIWLGIGLPSLPSVFSHHSAYENESPLVANTNDPAQPRPHAAPSSPLGKTAAVHRQDRKPTPHLVPATSASGERATAATAAPKVAPSGAVQPRLEAAVPKQAAAPARDAAPGPAAPQAATRPETVAAPQTTTVTTTTSTTTTTQTSTTETPGPPPPPVTVPSLPDLPDLPLPNELPLPPVPPVPTVTVPQVPQTPPLPAVEPPSQLPPVPTQTPTVPTLP
jgi:membrane peptidoglycan carboxypeptidase